MTDFLEFLNSADEETLLNFEGMPKTLPKRLIAARPIETTEDCLKIKGMSEKLFTSLQTVFLQQKQEKMEDAIEALEAEEAEEERRETKPWVKAIRWLLILLVILAAAFAAFKYGVPYIYNTFLKPVENNAALLNEVAATQSADTARLNAQLIALTNRVATLEARADAVDAGIASLTASIDDLNAVSASLDAKVAYELDLSRALHYLSRARLYLSQDNNGLARADVVSARNLLYTLIANAPTAEVYALNETINNLDLALSNLPAYPVVAVYYVDIAWQYLADDLSATAPTVIPPTAAPTEAPVQATATP
jgi:hypothetical protein